MESKGRGVNACMEVEGFLDELFRNMNSTVVESLDGNPDTFLEYLTPNSPRSKYLLMKLVVAAYGESDDISDTNVHVTIDGVRYMFFPVTDTARNLFSMNPTFTGIQIDSISVTVENSVMKITLRNLRFSMEITDPITYSADVSLDVYAEIPVNATVTDDGTVYTQVFDGFRSLDITMNGDRWPHFEYNPWSLKAKYGDEEYTMGYTVTLTADADGYPKTLIVPFGVGISSGSLPTLSDPLFRGWKTQSGELIREWDYYPNGGYILTEDTVLYACMYVEASDDVVDEIRRVKLMADPVKNTYEGSMYQVDFTTLLPASDLLDLLLLVEGEIDDATGKPYITLDGKHLYGEHDDGTGVDSTAMVAGRDYSYTVTGIGSSAWGESSVSSSKTVTNVLAEADISIEFMSKSGDSLGSASTRINEFRLVTNYNLGVSDWIESSASIEFSYQTAEDNTVSGEMHYVLGDDPIGYYGEYWFDPVEL